MKIIKKSVAVALATLMAGSALSGCTQATVFGKYPNDYSWSYKDDNSELSIGSYIFYQYMSFYDASSRLNNATGDFLGKTLKDDDGKEVIASDYIKTSVDEACRYHLYVNKVFNDMGLKLTPQETAEYKTNADTTWSSISTALEGFGVSKESFVEAYSKNPAKLQAIFKATYTEGGKKEVKIDDLKKHYTDNYVNYSYFYVPLYETTTDEEGNMASEKMTEDEIKAVKANMKKYTDDINNGKTYEEEIAVYMADYEVESDPTITATNILEKSGLPEDIVTALEGMKDKEAKYIMVGEDGDSPICYLVYRGDIQNEVKNLESNEDLKIAVITEMKSEEFRNDMIEAAKAYKCEINTAAIEKYPASMFITEPATEASTETFTTAG